MELDISVKIESIFNLLSLEMIEAFYEDIVGHTYLNKLSFKWKKGTFSIINVKIKGMEIVKKALTEFLNYSMFLMKMIFIFQIICTLNSPLNS